MDREIFKIKVNTFPFLSLILTQRVRSASVPFGELSESNPPAQAPSTPHCPVFSPPNARP